MTEVATVAVPEKLYQEVCTQSARVDVARSTYNVANERAKGAKKYLEAAQETLESLIRRFTTPEADLPLFTNQSEKLDAANADPVVSKLVERLLARGHDVNTLIVFGYTEDERAQVAKYLDILDANEAEFARVADGSETATIETCEVPAFLVPQPLTAIEVADLIGRLSAADLAIAPEEIEAWKQTQLADAKAWLAQVEAVKSAKGDAVTFDDLPAVPEWLGEKTAVIDEHVQEQIEAIKAGEAEVEHDDAPAEQHAGA